MVSKKEVKKPVKRAAKKAVVKAKSAEAKLVESAPVQEQKLIAEPIANMGSQKEGPVLVKVIAVLFGILGVLMIIGGIVILALGKLIADALPLEIAMYGAGLVAAIGIFAILFGILYGFVCRGLWKLQLWARIVAIILTCLGVLFLIVGLASGGNTAGDVIWMIIRLIINGLIAGYLLFAPEAKEAFA